MSADPECRPLEVYSGARFFYRTLIDLDTQLLGVHPVKFDGCIILDFSSGDQEFRFDYVLSSFFRAAGKSILLSMRR